ncbi:hypothetical protein Hdeb2414_s0005g00159101 [Helianthus debilis subsp. tardiflorus]
MTSGNTSGCQINPSPPLNLRPTSKVRVLYMLDTNARPNLVDGIGADSSGLLSGTSSGERAMAVMYEPPCSFPRSCRWYVVAK